MATQPSLSYSVKGDSIMNEDAVWARLQCSCRICNARNIVAIQHEISSCLAPVFLEHRLRTRPQVYWVASVDTVDDLPEGREDDHCMVRNGNIDDVPSIYKYKDGRWVHSVGFNHRKRWLSYGRPLDTDVDYYQDV